MLKEEGLEDLVSSDGYGAACKGSIRSNLRAVHFWDESSNQQHECCVEELLVRFHTAKHPTQPPSGVEMCGVLYPCNQALGNPGA